MATLRVKLIGFAAHPEVHNWLIDLGCKIVDERADVTIIRSVGLVPKLIEDIMKASGKILVFDWARNRDFRQYRRALFVAGANRAFTFSPPQKNLSKGRLKTILENL